MRGPIDYIVVGFEGNKFDGSILSAIADAIDAGTIALIELAIVSRDNDDNVIKANISDFGDAVIADFAAKYAGDQSVDSDDLDEVADLIEKNCTAGLLIIEHLWAKPLKEALINANGVLLAEGRIHPDAAALIS